MYDHFNKCLCDTSFDPFVLHLNNVQLNWSWYDFIFYFTNKKKITQKDGGKKVPCN